MGISLNRLVFPDGEARLEFKVVSGHDRGGFILSVREGPPGTGYAAAIAPALGVAALLGGNTQLGARNDLAEIMSRDDWNSIAIRARGPDLWLLVNDQLVGQASDPRFDSGRLSFALRRLGDPNDEPETAAVIRNLRISRLADGDPARAPVSR
jgi:hypothetical protein